MCGVCEWMTNCLQVTEGFEEVVKVQFRIDRAGLSDENFQLVRSFL